MSKSNSRTYDDVELGGVCIVCSATTPVSENTIHAEGIVCVRCLVYGREPARVREFRIARVAALEDELHRLKEALSNAG